MMSRRSLAYKNLRFQRRWIGVFIPVCLALVVIKTIVATADSMWNLGWGHDWDDVAQAFVMLGLIVAFWVLWLGMAKLVERLFIAVFGPDPSEDN